MMTKEEKREWLNELHNLNQIRQHIIDLKNMVEEVEEMSDNLIEHHKLIVNSSEDIEGRVNILNAITKDTMRDQMVFMKEMVQLIQQTI